MRPCETAVLNACATSVGPFITFFPVSAGWCLHFFFWFCVFCLLGLSGALMGFVVLWRVCCVFLLWCWFSPFRFPGLGPTRRGPWPLHVSCVEICREWRLRPASLSAFKRGARNYTIQARSEERAVSFESTGVPPCSCCLLRRAPRVDFRFQFPDHVPNCIACNFDTSSYVDTRYSNYSF